MEVCSQLHTTVAWTLGEKTPHPYILNKDSTDSLVGLEREKSLAPARDQTLASLPCSLVTVLTLLSWLLIDIGRRRNRVSIFFLSPTFKTWSCKMMRTVSSSKYRYNRAGHWTFNWFCDLPTATGTDFYLVNNSEQIHSPVSLFSPVCK